jgi:glycosyltransferase involved in cell wall biosynthesis
MKVIYLNPRIDVSVIIPTFNRLSFLYPTLLCLINQKITSNIGYEIIIVDSGDDGTGKFMSSLPNKNICPIQYKKIKNSKNRSLLRNTGTESAKGNILVFVDNDMLVPPHFIETHYQTHLKIEKLVLLGKRLSLTEFNIDKIGKDVIVNNFSILDTMPYYRDVRDYFLDDRGYSIENIDCPWRFVYSHNFSVSRELFFISRKFNVKFGDHWGLEDIEFGFSLFRNGGVFRMAKDIPVYHQSHFEQSKTDQASGTYNCNLFQKLRPFFDVEIFINSGDVFDMHYKTAMSIKKDIFSRIDTMVFSKYDLILGCLYSCGDKNKLKKCLLGLNLQFENNSKRNILIIKTFHKFHEQMQLPILKEALRVGNIVDIQKFDEQDMSSAIINLCSIVGYDVCIQETAEYYRLMVKQKKKTKIFKITLPDVFSPRSRFFYLMFAYKLCQSGSRVLLVDTKETKHFNGEDFLLPKNIRDELASYVPATSRTPAVYGSCDLRYIAPAMLIHLGFQAVNGKEHIIFNDQQYKNLSQSPFYSGYERCTYFDHTFLERFTIQYIVEYIHDLELDSPISHEIPVYGAFMETGYLEDGIDIILESFAYAVKKGFQCRLVIKTPDYNALFPKNFRFHNESSRFGKNFGIMLKTQNDFYQLSKRIEELHLDNNVTFIKENMDIERIIKLIASFDGFICANRGVLIPCDVYAAVLLQKKVYIPEHCKIDGHFSEAVIRIGSAPFPFAQSFEAPVYSNNVGFLAYNINYMELGDKLIFGNPLVPIDLENNVYIKELILKNNLEISNI